MNTPPKNKISPLDAAVLHALQNDGIEWSADGRIATISRRIPFALARKVREALLSIGARPSRTTGEFYFLSDPRPAIMKLRSAPATLNFSLGARFRKRKDNTFSKLEAPSEHKRKSTKYCPAADRRCTLPGWNDHLGHR